MVSLRSVFFIRIDSISSIENCQSLAEALFKGYKAADVLKEPEKDDIFYFHSGGGVTLSGGEPLQQLAFIKEILAGCWQGGIHTTIETRGFVLWSHFAETLPLLEAILIDIKVMDPQAHRRVTDKSNATGF